MADDQRRSASGRRRLQVVASVAAVGLLLIGGVVGFAWGLSAGDPTRQVTGVVDNFNDHAISLTDVEGVDGGTITAAFALNPQVEIHDGDTVRGTFVEFDEPDRYNTFIVEKVVSSGG